jgi:hypothetical protein
MHLALKHDIRAPHIDALRAPATPLLDSALSTLE